MNILKYLLPCITLLFFITTGVYAHDSDKKKNHNNDGKKYHEKMWSKKGNREQCPMTNMFGQCPMMGMGHPPMMGMGPPPMMGMGHPPMMGMGGSFAMIEAQGRLFLYNKRNGDVWICSAFKKSCEQIVIEKKDIE
jgi:hypothetical protein